MKYGFMAGDGEEKNTRTKSITEMCARYKLLVDFHDYPVHPYGQMRTWPNAVTREYCKAQLDGHEIFYPKTFVTSVNVAICLAENSIVLFLLDGFKSQITDFFFIFPCPWVNILYLPMQTLVAKIVFFYLLGQ